MALQDSIERLAQACRASNISVHAYFGWPFADIVSFAKAHDIPLGDLKKICQLLLGQLDKWDRAIEVTRTPSLH